MNFSKTLLMFLSFMMYLMNSSFYYLCPYTFDFYSYFHMVPMLLHNLTSFKFHHHPLCFHRPPNQFNGFPFSGSFSYSSYSLLIMAKSNSPIYFLPYCPYVN